MFFFQRKYLWVKYKIQHTVLFGFISKEEEEEEVEDDEEENVSIFEILIII